MKHNFLTDEVKKAALDEYLAGKLTAKQVCEKYEMCQKTFHNYKKRNENYVKEQQLKKNENYTIQLKTNKPKSSKKDNDFIDFVLSERNSKNNINTNNNTNNKDNDYNNINTFLGKEEVIIIPKKKTKKHKIVSYESEIEKLISDAGRI